MPRTALSKATALVLVSLSTIAILASCRTTPDPLVIEPFGTEPAVDLPTVDLPPDPGWAARRMDTSVFVGLPEPFIKLVDLDRLRIGMTKQEVLAIFPNPNEIKLQRDDELWLYGFAQLIFRGNRLRDWFDLK